jgi:hypothetical protein
MKQLNDFCEMLDSAKIEYDYDESSRDGIVVSVKQDILMLMFNFDHGGHFTYIDFDLDEIE